ncbi:MAG: DUF2922 domain-containing protein [Bacillota bacterium]
MAKVLRMTFQNAQGRTVSINLQDPVDPLDAADVSACMDKVVIGNIFSTSGGDIIAKLKAETIETSVETVVDYT